MVSPKKQTVSKFPFFSKKNDDALALTTNRPISRYDVLFKRFSFIFFGIILLFLSIYISQHTKSISAEHIAVLKKSTQAKINIEKEKPVKAILVASNKTKNETVLPKVKPVEKTTSEISPKKVETSKTTSFWEKNQPAKKIVNAFPIAKTKVEHSSPIIAAKPKAITKKSIRKTPKKVAQKKKTPKATTKTATEELVVNPKITNDLLPLAFFEAKNKAANEGKTMLIKFGAKWCLPCREMESSTFKHQLVKNKLNENYVTLSVDIDDFDGHNLKSYYNVNMLPTMLVFNAQGQFLAKYARTISANEMLEVLDKHRPTDFLSTKVESEKLKITKPVQPTKVLKASMLFQKVIAKKRNGNAITELRGKAKNWRTTTIKFSTTNVNDGILKILVKDLKSGNVLNEEFLPVTPLTNQKAITDTTSSYQLDISHEKRKDKTGEYAIEIYHASPQKVRLIGKTSFLKDGKFIWTK